MFIVKIVLCGRDDLSPSTSLVSSLRPHQQEQYLFLHRAVLEAYTARDTLVPVDRFDVIWPQPITADSPDDRIDKEFEVRIQITASFKFNSG